MQIPVQILNITPYPQTSERASLGGCVPRVVSTGSLPSVKWRIPNKIYKIQKNYLAEYYIAEYYNAE